MICIKNCAIEKECRLHSNDRRYHSTIINFLYHIFIIILKIQLTLQCDEKNALLDCKYWKIKITHEKIIDIKKRLILQIVPRQVHSWWLCHHLSEKEAAVSSCSLATIYQCFSDQGFTRQLLQPPACGCVGVRVTVTTKT